jgi:hypothetical protein
MPLVFNQVDEIPRWKTILQFVFKRITVFQQRFERRVQEVERLTIVFIEPREAHAMLATKMGDSIDRTQMVMTYSSPFNQSRF